MMPLTSKNSHTQPLPKQKCNGLQSDLHWLHNEDIRGPSYSSFNLNRPLWASKRRLGAGRLKLELWQFRSLDNKAAKRVSMRRPSFTGSGKNKQGEKTANKQLHHAAPCCTMLHHAAPCCTMLHHAAPCCTCIAFLSDFPWIHCIWHTFGDHLSCIELLTFAEYLFQSSTHGCLQQRISCLTHSVTLSVRCNETRTDGTGTWARSSSTFSASSRRRRTISQMGTCTLNSK